MNLDPSNPSSASDPARLEHLVDQIIDEPDTSPAWDEFRVFAAQSPLAWQRLAKAQHMMRDLQYEFRAAAAPAMAVELATANSRSGSWSIAMRTYVGWAAALLIAVGWLVSDRLPSAPTRSQPTIVPVAQTDGQALLDEYLAQPFVIGELPPQLYDVNSDENGEVVTFVRQILERRHMRLFDVAVEDGLNPVLRPADAQPRKLVSRF